jgi:hypothetical protein
MATITAQFTQNLDRLIGRLVTLHEPSMVKRRSDIPLSHIGLVVLVNLNSTHALPIHHRPTYPIFSAIDRA